MAVSKTHPAEAIAEAAAAGLTLFGENRVQEFEAKRAALLQTKGIEVHLIGHLQSNKSAKAAELFDAVDTVDSLRLAQRLNEAAGKWGRRMPLLLEVKLSPEPSKAGLDPDAAETFRLLEQLAELPHIEMRGLMTIAPRDENPESARACFRRLRMLRDAWSARYPRLNFAELSMGMSGDFEIGVEEGSTLVRVGTAIFGRRPRPA